MENTRKQNISSNVPDNKSSVAGFNSLNELHHEFNVFLNLTPSAIFAVDTSRRITRWNKRAEEITGYTAGEVTGKECWIFADSPCKTHCGLFDPDLKKPLFGRECVIITKSGEKRYILKNVNVLTGSSGEVTGGVESFEDITYQKVIENQLKQREINFLTFFNASEDLLFVSDLSGNIILANQTAVSKLGYKAPEINQMKLYDLLPPHLTEQGKVYFKDILEGRRRNCNLPLIDINKRIIPAETTVSKGLWNNEEAMFVVSKDISELLLSEEKFAKAFESNPSAMAISLPEGGFINVNRAFETISGFSKNEIIGKTSGDLDFFKDPDIRPFLKEKFRETGKIENFDLSLKARDGTIRTGLLSMDSIEIQNNRFILMIFNDLTESIIAKEEAAGFMEKLKQSNANLEQFAYIASHDLQEPLRKILAFSERLTLKYSENLDDTGLDYLNRMHSAAGRMQKMIDDLLAFSRISTRGNTFTAVSLEEVFNDTLADLEVMLETTHAKIYHDELPVIDADLAQMRQLFMNLIGNSLKYRQPEIIPEIQLRCQYPGNNIAISFTDNGIGFEEKYSSVIFQPFQRLHGRSQYEGSGIGLAICKKIVERHKGSIEVISHPNNGSTFIVTLPIHQPEL